jgi:FixJ family two-component response regulator
MLTPQQLKILKLKVSGSTNREIASALGNSENTVKRIFTEVCMKLNLVLSPRDSRKVRDLIIEKALADYQEKIRNI